MDERAFKKIIDDLKNAKKYEGYELEEKVRACTGVAVSLILCPNFVMRVMLQSKFKKWIDTTDLDDKTKELFKRFLVSNIKELVDLIESFDIDARMKHILLSDIAKVFS